METRLMERMTYQVVAAVASGGTVTDAVHLWGRPILGLLVPAVNGTAPEVNVRVSADEGVTWYDLLEDDGSTQALTVTAGGTAYAVSSDELTPLAAYVGTDMRVLLVIDTAQTAEREFTWIVCG